MMRHASRGDNGKPVPTRVRCATGPFLMGRDNATCAVFDDAHPLVRQSWTTSVIGIEASVTSSTFGSTLQGVGTAA